MVLFVCPGGWSKSGGSGSVACVRYFYHIYEISKDFLRGSTIIAGIIFQERGPTQPTPSLI